MTRILTDVNHGADAISTTVSDDFAELEKRLEAYKDAVEDHAHIYSPDCIDVIHACLDIAHDLRKEIGRSSVNTHQYRLGQTGHVTGKLRRIQHLSTVIVSDRFSPARQREIRGIRKQWVRSRVPETPVVLIGVRTLNNGLTEHMGEDGNCWHTTDTVHALLVVANLREKPFYVLPHQFTATD